jgi:U4/U6.U5 tri-snRNP-associated protein 1
MPASSISTPVLNSALIEDELQNIEMAEEERTRKNNDLKIKKRDYTGYDDEEFAEGNVGMKRSVLAKYDEDIEGTRETVSLDPLIKFFANHPLQGFRLGSSMISNKAKQVEEKLQAATSVNKSLLSIDYASKKVLSIRLGWAEYRCLENLETMDYLNEGDPGFKKPKVRSVS